jgi:hypothetical protein
MVERKVCNLTVYSIFIYEIFGFCLLNLDYYEDTCIQPQNYLSEESKMLIIFVVIELYLPPPKVSPPFRGGGTCGTL